ncbi:LAMI_0D06436g1_1 [Lachancea mirantina]|uniref:LAMI_0D06436g1_1 n=1 Tax=Lachancea mirantina TaxID=1230905 RepID=A0A1G4JBP6_9SACH|nr:LAMI_0D06436g1_1 [Lachancea mirantina]
MTIFKSAIRDIKNTLQGARRHKDMLRTGFKRFQSTWNAFKLFPRTFPDGQAHWDVDLKKLRKEFRDLQAMEHPDTNGDKNGEKSAENSAMLNKAYQTLRQPLLRAQFLLKLRDGVDVTDEKMAQKVAQQEPTLLMRVLDVHEQLEEACEERQVRELARENRSRMSDVETQLSEAFAKRDVERAKQLTVELKYWTTLDQAVREWEPEQPGKA